MSSTFLLFLSPVTDMHSLKWVTRGTGRHIGKVIPVIRIRSPAHIIPNFGHKAHPHLTISSSYELSNDFWLNKYWMKEFYYTLSRVTTWLLHFVSFTYYEELIIDLRLILQSLVHKHPLLTMLIFMNHPAMNSDSQTPRKGQVSTNQQVWYQPSLSNQHMTLVFIFCSCSWPMRPHSTHYV